MTDTPKDAVHQGMNDGLYVHIERLGSALHALVSGLHLHVPPGEILTRKCTTRCGSATS